MKELETVCRRLQEDPRILAVYLFGSTADGSARDDSDVDLAVLAAGPLTLGEELRLSAIAVEELHRDDVDFVVLNRATPLLRYEVVTGGRRLFARHDAAMDAWEHRAIMEFMDTAYLRRLEQDILREATR